MSPKYPVPRFRTMPVPNVVVPIPVVMPTDEEMGHMREQNVKFWEKHQDEYAERKRWEKRWGEKP